MEKILSEENLIDFVEQYLQEGLKPVEMFKRLNKLASENQKKYASIKYNYASLFIYYLIQKQVPIEDFAQVLPVIYEQELNAEQPNLEHTFSRFFNYREVDITLFGYMTLIGDDPVAAPKVKDEYHPSIYDKMYYTFLLKEDDKPVFNKQTLPYLLEMLKAIKPEHFKPLQYGKFSIYCGYNHIAQNPIELKPILELNNPALEQEKEGEYYGLSKSIIIYIAQDSYERNDDNNRQKFEHLAQIIPNFEQAFIHAAISVKQKGKERIQIENGVVNFSRFGNINLAQAVVNKYQEEYLACVALDKKRELRRLMDGISASVSVYFEKIVINDFTGLIDTSKELAYNLPGVILLELAATQKQNINITQEQKDYLTKELTTFQAEKDTSFNEFSFILGHEKIENLLITLSYLHLNEVLDLSSEKKQKARKI